MKKNIFLPVLLSLSVCFFLFACKQQQDSSFTETKNDQYGTKKEQLPQHEVDNEEGAVRQEITVTGEVVPDKEQNLTFSVEGVLEKGQVEYLAGTSFEKDDLLLQLNNAAYFAGIKEQKLQYKKMVQEKRELFKATFPVWENQFETFYEEIRIQQLLPDLPFLDTEIIKWFKSNGLYTPYFRVKELEENMKDFFMLAPFNGYFTELKVSVGKTVKKGQVVAKISSSKKTYVKTTLPLQTFIQMASPKDIIISVNGQSYTGKIINSDTKGKEMVELTIASTPKIPAYQIGKETELKIQYLTN